MPTTIEDRLVVGDATVVADLYRQHGAFVHTISQQLVGAAADRLTQQIFVDAWRDRLDFNPSLGTIRNWLARRARDRVSKPSAEADLAVDRLVVADSLARMDPIRREVLVASVVATDLDQLAAQFDLPVATVNGHLRRGMATLKSDLADSRADESDGHLADILAAGVPEAVLTDPPRVVWNAVAAELRLRGDAADIDREQLPSAAPEPEHSADDLGARDPEVDGSVDDADVAGGSVDDADVAGGSVDDADVAGGSVDDADVAGGSVDDGDVAGGSVDDADVAGGSVDDGDVAGGSADAVDDDDDSDPAPSTHEEVEGGTADDALTEPVADRVPGRAGSSAGDDEMDTLQADAEMDGSSRPIWRNPAVLVVSLIILALLIAIIF
ncbi:MAG: hypothetical protein OER95_18870 [Acidimicrobiia bacterium]|nr:hypothetical protein [Acidimicrobiia bacterium]